MYIYIVCIHKYVCAIYKYRPMHMRDSSFAYFLVTWKAILNTKNSTLFALTFCFVYLFFCFCFECTLSCAQSAFLLSAPLNNSNGSCYYCYCISDPKAHTNATQKTKTTNSHRLSICRERKMHFCFDWCLDLRNSVGPSRPPCWKFACSCSSIRVFL